ncbi:MAG TPA: LysR family transcriptional regulator, partial [Burkholderiales bacterium]|nr:LysR family transcriptional regulator [Burkholderiales bacterium]
MIYRLPPLNALRVFEAAARHLSFKEAAAELNITQTAVSHQIKSLEEYLGVELFRRAGRGVALTEAARAALPRLREGFDSLAEAMEALRERAAESELIITAPPVFTARWLMPRLADFARREQRIDVRVVGSSKMVDGGALDSAALLGNLDLREESSGVEIHLGAGNYPGYRADRLFSVATTAVAGPDLAPALKAPEDLAHHVLLHDDAMDLVANGGAWQKWLEAAGVADRVDGTRGPHFSSNILSLEAAS